MDMSYLLEHGELDEVLLVDDVGGMGPIAYVPKANAPADTSDGYHTFQELYDHRSVLFCALCNMVGFTSPHDVFKSRLHRDGSSYDGYFIAGILTELGWVTYRLEDRWWDGLCAAELDRAPEWDGHTPGDVLDRLVYEFDMR